MRNTAMRKTHFLIAPDSFKESMTAIKATQAIAQGLKQAYADEPEKLQMTLMPLADGGEGTMSILAGALEAQTHTVMITGPLSEQRLSQYTYSADKQLAIIEIAKACGLDLVPKENRNPLYTTTYGVGELVQAALQRGAKKILFALGGSATNDCGVGMLASLGAKFYDRTGKKFIPYNGTDLGKICEVDLAPVQELLAGIKLEVACDVDNPLLGEQGATYVFAQQKGADYISKQVLELNMHNFIPKLELASQKKLAMVPKTGAAGGLGAALLAIDAKMKSGIMLVLELLEFEQYVQQADYIITGEGSIDAQTINGKTISGVAYIAKKHHVPVIVLAGKVGDQLTELYTSGVTAIFGIISDTKPLAQILADGENNLITAAENIGRLVRSTETKEKYIKAN